MPGDFVCKDAPYSLGAGETGEMIQVSWLYFWVRLLLCQVLIELLYSLSRSLKVMSILPVITFRGREIREILVPSPWGLLMGRLRLLSGLHGG